MNQELVSIAMPTYNGEAYLREQLDSIFTQSYTNIEVVVCDDQSTDGTIAILKEYAAKFRIRYFVNAQRLGISGNFEKAISHCTGVYIGLSDQDDVWLPTKVEELYIEMKKQEIQHVAVPLLVHCDSYITDVNLQKTGKVLIGDNGSKTGLNKILFGNSKVQGASCLLNKLFVDQVFPLPADLKLYDLFFSFFSDTIGKRVYLNKPLMFYRQHPNNVIGAIYTGPSKVSKALSNSFVLHTQGEYETILLFQQRYQEKLNAADQKCLCDYFTIVDTDASLFKKLILIVKNKFSASHSMLKLLMKVVFGSLKKR